MSAPQTAVAQRRAWGVEALAEVRDARRKHQESIAADRDEFIRSNRYFYDHLRRALQFIVPPGKDVLDVRCDTGYMLASLRPALGIGVEISEAMVERASSQHPELQFVQCDPEDLDLDQKFDYILFNHIFDTVDILRSLERIKKHCTSETRIVVINYNYAWTPILDFASKLGLRSQSVEPNWISENDVRGFLKLAGFRPVRIHRLMLCPKWIPGLSLLLNGLLARLPGLRAFCMMQIIVARLVAEPKRENDVAVSVVVPCRNEVGNVQQAVERIPVMGKHTEILFCDDRSTDGTAAEVRRMMALYPDKDIRLIEGPGMCKAENVWTGFRAAKGDILVILDADLTVMPEELPMFVRALLNSRGEFVNGSRLVYPVPQFAMKFANTIGNKLFGRVFSFLLDQRIKDTLCGTKVLWRKDWLRMETNVGMWGVKDLWGDYELLFGASKLHLEIVEVPVHYQERMHGVTKMTKVFSNGLRMLRICWHAWFRLGG